MQDIQTGHGEVPRGETFVLSDAFIEQVGEAGVKRFVAVLAEAEQYAAEHTEEEVADFLRSRLEGTDLERPEHSYDITASLLRGSHGRFSVMTNTGRVLHGRPPGTPTQGVPSVRGTEDPSDPDRPFYS